MYPMSEQIRVAFVYGSIASQKDRAGSDLDLMIIGEADFGKVVSILNDAQKKLRREINPSVYTLAEFRSKLREGNHFLTSVLQKKKLFVAGDENDLRELSSKRLVKRTSHER